ncbi:DUF5329 domain-containing protein [Endozoicomonas elysicola]|uniref:DUF5329 domain-containing protein n=1 Tax=Endozoicomonas elysicola TaxID=305900 RepID=A0A081K5N8_9GAMM|nr:DUF5329 family protein [Endozoicomonas elysicola]KEI69464.1 hypothetical protein GV64_00785 [Endozoicomonas elysicola]
MKIFSLTFLLLINISVLNNAYAETPSSEIDHLIAYVARSNCDFIRNGSSHPSSEAVEHMQNKYKYFRKKIKTAEQFIEMSASKSTLSGKPYWIKCPDRKEVPSQAWLLEELSRYRQNK